MAIHIHGKDELAVQFCQAAPGKIKPHDDAVFVFVLIEISLHFVIDAA
jgi:hypothetical protein